jgi:hypothetical protein
MNKNAKLILFKENEETTTFANLNNFSPAIEDKGIKYKNELTFNLMELITKMKNNKSLNKNIINSELLINVSLILNLCKEKNTPLELQKTGNENKVYSFYFPLKKISIDNKIYNGGLEKLNRGIIIDYQENENNSQNETKDFSFDNNSNKSLSNENLSDINSNDNEIYFYECPILSDEKENSKDYLHLFDEIMKIEDEENKYYNSLSLNNTFNFYIENSPNQSNINLSNYQKKKQNLILNYLSPNSSNNFIKSMNKDYVQIMLFHYLNIKKLINSTENYVFDESFKFNYFITLIKKFLLENNINDISVYNDIIKYLLFQNKIVSFEEFLSCFDSFLSLSKTRNREKYCFLFNIIKKSKDQKYYTKKDIEIFFKLISASKIYEEEFSEDIIERLINRYKAIYKNDIINGKYNIRKLNITLETFFEDYF